MVSNLMYNLYKFLEVHESICGVEMASSVWAVWRSERLVQSSLFLYYTAPLHKSGQQV